MQSIVLPKIPVLGSYTKPLPHCTVKQIKRLLLGTDLSTFKDDDGTLAMFYETLQEDIIPEASQKLVNFCRTNFDYTREIWYFDGSGTEELILPRRNIQYVNAVFLRFLPQQIWYRFVRPRLIDGGAFIEINGVEPPPPAPEPRPPEIGEQTYEQTVRDVMYTGAEDADLYVDRRRRAIIIPPRVLYANVQSPLWNYNFFTATMNVEVHFAYGFPPTSYLDGQSLRFDPITGEMIELSPPTAEGCGSVGVDWSSGMPKEITQACARLAYCDVMRRLWRGKTNGLSSMSVDGASESYGGRPYGGDIDSEEARVFEMLKPWAIAML